MDASTLCLLAAGIFFLSGLLTGVWKYGWIHASQADKACAPMYVDIAHRASLMYSFAAILLHEFVPYSPVSPYATLWAVGMPLLFFALAIASYILHGALQDTDNQLHTPHILGRMTLPPAAMLAFMIALIVAEIGGFLVLFWGFLQQAF